MRKVGGFAGFPWSDAILGFSRQEATKNIGTASAAQVTRGLNAEGIGQWRRYRAQLEPVLPILAPWVKRFGYSED